MLAELPPTSEFNRLYKDVLEVGFFSKRRLIAPAPKKQVAQIELVSSLSPDQINPYVYLLREEQGTQLRDKQQLVILDGWITGTLNSNPPSLPFFEINRTRLDLEQRLPEHPEFAGLYADILVTETVAAKRELAHLQNKYNKRLKSLYGVGGFAIISGVAMITSILSFPGTREVISPSMGVFFASGMGALIVAEMERLTGSSLNRMARYYSDLKTSLKDNLIAYHSQQPDSYKEP